jgi:uncharacterized protein
MADKGKQGFASLDPERRKELGRRGGQTAHRLGHAHTFTQEERRKGVKEAAAGSVATRPTWLRLGAEVGRIGRGATLRLAAYTGRSPKVNGLKGSFRQERKTREGYLYEPF